MAKPIGYEPAYGTYARPARLVFEEMGVDDLVRVDLIAGATKAPEHLARHPSGKVPRQSAVKTKPKLG